MNIEVGKKYTTRGGGIVAITSDTGPNPFTGKSPTYGFRGYMKGCSDVLAFTGDGKFWNIGESPNDLIDEYIEPPTALELATYIGEHILTQKANLYSSPEYRKAAEMRDAIIAAAK